MDVGARQISNTEAGAKMKHQSLSKVPILIVVKIFNNAEIRTS